MSKTAVVYWSGTGNTKAMAAAVQKGAEGAGAEVTVFGPAAFTADMVKDFDGIAFGCPAMGAEVLEEDEFDPMWQTVKGALTGKRIALFGAFGWGTGEWMDDWADDARDAGADLVADPVIANESPDDAALAACEALGAKLA